MTRKRERTELRRWRSTKQLHPAARRGAAGKAPPTRLPDVDGVPTEDKERWAGALTQIVQDKFHDYLEVRGINSDLASYIVEAHLDKEQREYTNWLGNVSKFVADKKETE